MLPDPPDRSYEGVGCQIRCLGLSRIAKCVSTVNYGYPLHPSRTQARLICFPAGLKRGLSATEQNISAAYPLPSYAEPPGEGSTTFS